MNYKQLKSLAKICDQKAEPGQAIQSPVFGDDMCYATDTYVLVRVTGRGITELCAGLEAPSQVPSVLIDGFGARQTVKLDDISIFGIDPVITTKIKQSTDFPYVLVSGESADFEVKACIAGKRKR